MADRDDHIDGCACDLTIDPVSDDDLWAIVLSPDGDAEQIERYAALFGRGERGDAPPVVGS